MSRLKACMNTSQRTATALAIVTLSVPNAPAKEWHVAPDGSGTNPGTATAPFSTLTQARDAIRAHRVQHGTDEPHTVIIHGGLYHLEEAFVLERRDGGRQQAPVTYRAAAGQEVRFTTGTDVPNDLFRPAGGTELDRLHPTARGKVIVADLAGSPVAKAFPEGRGQYGLLTWDGYTLQLGRWPNRGYNHLDKVIDMGPTLRWLTANEKEPPYSFEKPIGGKFTLRESANFAAWKKELERTRDVWQDGYLSIDWAQDANQVARVSEDGVIQLLDSTRYGIGGVRYKGGFANPSHKPTFMPYRRLVFENLLCEVDMPGEWYFDRQDQKLYLWPVTPDYQKAHIAIPGGPTMIKLKDTQHITIRGIIFENGGPLGLAIEGGAHNTIAGCTFRNFSGRAATVSGRNNGFNGCDFYNLESGFSMRGGVLKTLTRANNYAINCDFHHFRNRGYGGLGLEGCGLIFKNNIYHDMNAGIKYSGVYIDITHNEFFNVGWEMGDWNVLYQGASKWCNGNRVAHNFFHHMMEEPTRYPVLGARNDDGGTGTTYQSNIFYKTGRGAIAFGGPNCHILDNIVLECSLIWWTAKTPTSPKHIQEQYDEIARQFESGRYPRGGKEDAIYNVEQVVGPRGWNKPPWSTAFPNFPKYMNENPFAQSCGSMLNNYHNRVDPNDPYKVVHIHANWSLLEPGEPRVPPTMKDMPDTFRYNAPRTIDINTAFVDPESLDFRFAPGFQPMPGFQPCDFAHVGLFRSEFRPNPPDPAVYRRALYQRFKSTPSSGGRYDPDTVRLRYPVPPWIEASQTR